MSRCRCNLNGCPDCDDLHPMHNLSASERRTFRDGMLRAAEVAEEYAELISAMTRDATVAREVAGLIRDEANP